MTSAINLRQLLAFQAVMVTGSASLAAERLHLTQPATSKHLMGLEYAVGLKLFSRRRGGAMTPTREGIAFYKASTSILAGVNELPQIADEIRRHARGRLRIAATPPVVNSRALAEALKDFRIENADVRLMLEPHHRLEIEDLVVSRQVDLAFALLPLESATLRAIPLVKTRAIAVVARDHELGRRTSISFQDLAEQTVILPSRQPMRTRIDSALSTQNMTLNVAIEASSAITCCRLAAAGLGVTICDPFSASAFGEADLRILDWSPHVELTYGALVSRDAEMQDIELQLLDSVERQFEIEAARILSLIPAVPISN